VPVNTSTQSSIHRYVNASTRQHINTSTQSSTHQHINTSTQSSTHQLTHQQINTSTHQHNVINNTSTQSSTHQPNEHIKPPTRQHMNAIIKYLIIDINTSHPHINTSTDLHINTSTHRHGDQQIDASTPQHINSVNTVINAIINTSTH
jgi:hypothetical protein